MIAMSAVDDDRRFQVVVIEVVAEGLLGFNLGLEAGQIFCVAIILIVSILCLNLLKIKRRDWVFFLSAGVFALAVKMAVERIPF